MEKLVKFGLLLLFLAFLEAGYYLFTELNAKESVISQKEKEIDALKKQKKETTVIQSRRTPMKEVEKYRNEENSDEVMQRKTVSAKFVKALYSYSADSVDERKQIIQETTTKPLQDSILMDTKEVDRETEMSVKGTEVYTADSEIYTIAILEQTVKDLKRQKESHSEICVKLSLQKENGGYKVNFVEQLSSVIK
ncbi:MULTISPECIES: hypothetical protein [Listeria]|uniref:hypothetical protein n=1 Tax=Listeria TaxID=1637 RepID=UPI000B592565|nr:MULTISPECIES: hypothetical protein [Listeria]